MPRQFILTGSLSIAVAAAAGCRSADETKGQPSGAPTATVDEHLPITSALVATWGSGPTDVWGVGSNGIIVHFDGRSWTASDSGTTKNLAAVHGTGPDDVWAVGDGAAAVHFDGKSWSVSEADLGEGVNLLGVWASSKTDVWASGIDQNVGLLRHYNGIKWEDLYITASSSLWEAWGSGPKDIWMVGSSNKGAGFVLRGDGAKFDAMPFDGGSLRGIWGTRPDDVWVIGYEGTLYHWDGTAWTAAPAMPDSRFLGVWGAGSTDIWTVGFDGTTIHYDGNVWSPSPTKTKQILWSVWGSAPDNVWAVGNGGTALHWKGQGWSG